MQNKTLPKHYTRIPTGLWRHPDRTDEQKMTLEALFTFCRPDEGRFKVWPSRKTLAEAMGLNASKNNNAVRNVLEELEKLGDIIVYDRKLAEGYKGKGYDVTPAWTWACELSVAHEAGAEAGTPVPVPGLQDYSSEQLAAELVRRTQAPVEAKTKEQSEAA